MNKNIGPAVAGITILIGAVFAVAQLVDVSTMSAAAVASTLLFGIFLAWALFGK